MRKFKGFFISFEGGDHLGKTTQLTLLQKALTEAGYSVRVTREPGGTPLGNALRELVLNPNWSMSKAAIMFLYQADRAQHYKDVLKPALRDGAIVLCDRYIDSTLVYQGYGGGWNLPFLYRLHNAATGMLFPDLTFVFDGTPLTPMSNTDTFERKGAEFQQKLREGYLRLADTNPRYKIVNANQDMQVVTQQIVNQVLTAIEQVGIIPRRVVETV
jgi:dTMP kinase